MRQYVIDLLIRHNHLTIQSIPILEPIFQSGENTAILYNYIVLNRYSGA